MHKACLDLAFLVLEKHEIAVCGDVASEYFVGVEIAVERGLARLREGDKLLVATVVVVAREAVHGKRGKPFAKVVFADPAAFKQLGPGRVVGENDKAPIDVGAVFQNAAFLARNALVDPGGDHLIGDHAGGKRHVFVCVEAHQDRFDAVDFVEFALQLEGSVGKFVPRDALAVSGEHGVRGMRPIGGFVAGGDRVQGLSDGARGHEQKHAHGQRRNDDAALGARTAEVALREKAADAAQPLAEAGRAEHELALVACALELALGRAVEMDVLCLADGVRCGDAPRAQRRHKRAYQKCKQREADRDRGDKR